MLWEMRSRGRAAIRASRSAKRIMKTANFCDDEKMRTPCTYNRYIAAARDASSADKMKYLDGSGDGARAEAVLFRQQTLFFYIMIS